MSFSKMSVLSMSYPPCFTLIKSMVCGLALLASGQAMAATCTSIAAGGDWATNATWLNAAVDGCNTTAGAADRSPDNTNDVIIASTTNPVTLSVDVGAQSVTINGGGKLSLGTGNNTLLISGNFTNNSTASASNVVLTGGIVSFDVAGATVGGSAVTTFGNLTTAGPGSIILPTGTASSIINGYISLTGSGGITGTVKFSDANHTISISAAQTIATLDTSLFTGTMGTITATGGFPLTVTTLIPPSAPSAAVKIFVTPGGGTLTVTNAPTGATCTSDAAATGTQAPATFPVTALGGLKTLICTKTGGGGGGAVSAPIFSTKEKPAVFSEELK